MMQHCPGCGSQLPDKASFCTHCGQALDALNDQTPQMLDKSEPPAILAKSEQQQDSQDVSALPGTSLSDEHQDAEKPMTLIRPLSQDTSSPAETNAIHEEEAQPIPSASSNPPSSLSASDGDVEMTLAFPAFEETPLPTEATPAELTENPEPKEAPQIPLPLASASAEIAEDHEPLEIPQAPLPATPAELTENPEFQNRSETPLPSESEPAPLEQIEDHEPLEIPQTPLPAALTEQTENPEPKPKEAPQTSLSSEPAPAELAENAESLEIPQVSLPTEITPREEINVSEPQEPVQLSLPLASAPLEQIATSEPQEQPEALLPVTPVTIEEADLSEPQRLSTTPSPAEEPAPGEQIETPEPQQLPTTPPPTEESAPLEQMETLALQAPSPAIPAAPEETETPKPQEQPKTSASAGTTGIAEEKTRALPPSSPKPATSSKAEIVEPQKPTWPSSSSKSVASSRAEIAEQETLVVPAIPKASLSRSASNESKNRPGPQTRAEFYADSNMMNYRGNQQYGNTLTRPRTVPSAPLPKPAPKPVRTIGGLIWSLISPIFKRARDAEPERPKEALAPSSLLGWLPIFALSSALGLFTTATAFNAARALTPGSELYYWLGLGLIYLPVVVRLVMPHASRAERVGLLCLVTICLFLTKVSLSPLYFSGYDEFLHWRTINDILNTGHLLTKNSLLPVSPFYPGLEIVTSALSNISGMSSIQAGFTVVGVACLIMVLSLFLLAELLSGSARLASITAVIYMANPHFLFFDTQFAYESLALPLATVVMLAMTRYETLNRNRGWVMLVAWTVLVAMDLTHHATNFVFEGLFLLWAIVYLFLRPLPLRKTIVIPTLFLGIALTVTTILVIGNIVISYFTSFFADISSEVAQDLGSGGNSSRQLFGGAGTVIQTPLWERLISLGSVGLITLAIPFLLLCFWRRYRRNSLVWVFAIIATFYPVLQVLRLTTSGAEISDRASAFIFIAISFLGAVAIVQFWPVRFLNWKHSAVISTAILVLFMGGIILGEGIPPNFMPGPYEASADSRSIDPEGIQAALWTRIYLGPNQRMYTDRVNQLLMSVYGDQYLVTKIGDGIDVTDVIFDPTVSAYEISRLQKGQVHYLAIDLRLSTQLPQDGFYYEQGESTTGPNGDTTAINRERLTKFDTVPQINRLFDSGDIAIYDTGGLINAPPIP